MDEYAHQRLVQQNIDWCRVKDGLEKYPLIGKYFSMDELKEKAPSPFFCHYLAWRISQWYGCDATERYLALFDRLVGEAEKIDGWDASRLEDPKYEAYWSVLWELQVADAFARCARVSEVEWLPSGPDLRVLVDGQKCYVECYAYMKRYAAIMYIKKLLGCLSPHFEVKHTISVPMRLPNGQGLVKFLDELFKPFLDGGQHLACLQQKASKCGCADVCVPAGACNLSIYLTDSLTDPPPNSNNAHGGGVHFGRGFVVDAIEKAVGNKKDKNALASHRPNALMVNCALTAEDYVADLDQTLEFYKGRLPDYALKEEGISLDAVCFFAHGVDRRLCLHSGHALYSDHVLAGILSALDCADH